MVLEKQLCCHQSGKSRSIWQLKLGQNWLMQQDNDPKHTSKSYNWKAEKKRINVFSRPYLDDDDDILTEMLWWEPCVNKCPQTSTD